MIARSATLYKEQNAVGHDSSMRCTWLRVAYLHVATTIACMSSSSPMMEEVQFRRQLLNVGAILAERASAR